MELNSSETNRNPLVESHNNGADKKWWDKVLDLQEAKDQTLFSLPMILTNLCYYLIPIISVMFAGHFGDLQLASSNLANSWSVVSGFSFLVGLSGALETLCGQSYGAKLYGMMGVYLQANCILSTLCSVLISILWWYSDIILIALHQDPSIAKLAGTYLIYLIPGLFAYGYLNNMLRFLQTQSVIIPLVWCSVAPLLVHIGICYALVHWTALGFKGPALAVSLSFWLSVFMLAFYILCAKRFEKTWEGFSLDSFHRIFGNLKLGLPSAGMVCLEYWAFEILVILSGLMPNSEITTSVIAMCVNTEGICYMIAYGLSAAASTRVSNELGSGNVGRAKHAVSVTLKLGLLLALIVDLALGLGHDAFAGLFSNSKVIIDGYTSVVPFLMLSILLDFNQGVLSGVARGCGWQHLAFGINLGAFYLVGMPIAAVLAFKLKLYAKGLWIGLVCGLFCQSACLLLLTLIIKWEKIDLSSQGSNEIQVLV
ncbi:hypothetical protein Leryth_010074 [Lithospermum erythrorhizon]|nr:hypothetical protein Leryth_010074 [Lithospermum erythrorhizon]